MRTRERAAGNAGWKTLLLLAATALGGCGSQAASSGDSEGVGTAVQHVDTPGAFTAVNPGANTQAEIVVPTSLPPENIATLVGRKYYDVQGKAGEPLWRAINHLREGIFKMTGKWLN